MLKNVYKNECGNFCGINLLKVTFILYSKIMSLRLGPIINTKLPEERQTLAVKDRVYLSISILRTAAVL